MYKKIMVAFMIIACSGFLFASDTLNITTDKSQYDTTDQQTVTITLESDNVSADVYLARVHPNGDFYTLNSVLEFSSENTADPVLTDWISVSGTYPVNISFSGLSTGTYQWYIILVTPNSTPTDLSNWIDYAYASFEIIDTDNIIAVASGDQFSLALKNDGTVWAWGTNGNGQLGNNNGGSDDSVSRYPVKVSSVTNITAIAAGGSHALALDSSGDVWAWGYNHYGQLGYGKSGQLDTLTEDMKLTPVKVSISNVVAISAGDQFSMALDADGDVWTWGYNVSGQLGVGLSIDDFPENKSLPTLVTKISDVISISAGGRHALAVTNDGTVYSWGLNTSGQLGNNSIINEYEPMNVSSLTQNAAKVSAGFSFSVALLESGGVYSWGRNVYGELGVESNADMLTSPEASELSNISSLSTGKEHGLAITNSGSVYSWGRNFYGQLGDGSNNDANTPIRISITNASQTACGYDHTLILKSDGTVWSFGRNFFGQLGNNTNNDSTTPVRVTFN